MQEVKFRSFAKTMSLLVKSNLLANKSGEILPELSPARLLFLGFLMATAGTNPSAFGLNDNVLKLRFPAVSLSGENTILEDYFYSIILNSQLEPAEVSDMFQATFEEFSRHRRFTGMLREVQKALRSTERPGRPSKITQDELPELLRLSNQFLPLCKALTRSQHSAPSRPLKDHLEFFKNDHPASVELLLKHVTKASKVLSDRTLLRNIKTASKRNEKLAFIFAGLAFDMAPQYAIQQGMLAKRNARPTAKS